MATDQELRNELVNYPLRNGGTGSRKKTVDTVVNEAAVASHDEGRAKGELNDLLTDPGTPVEGYGGARENVRLTSLQDAADYLKEHDGEVPFGWG